MLCGQVSQLVFRCNFLKCFGDVSLEAVALLICWKFEKLLCLICFSPMILLGGWVVMCVLVMIEVLSIKFLIQPDHAWSLDFMNLFITPTLRSSGFPSFEGFCFSVKPLRSVRTLGMDLAESYLIGWRWTSDVLVSALSVLNGVILGCLQVQRMRFVSFHQNSDCCDLRLI